VWTCQLLGLAEYVFALNISPFCYSSSFASLATDTEYVRGRLAKYTNDLLSLGIDGLRLDASKRMFQTFLNRGLSKSCDVSVDIHPDDIANISSRLTRRPYITQEVRLFFCMVGLLALNWCPCRLFMVITRASRQICTQRMATCKSMKHNFA